MQSVSTLYIFYKLKDRFFITLWMINVLICVLKAREVRPSNQKAEAREEGDSGLHGQRNRARNGHGGD